MLVVQQRRGAAAPPPFRQMPSMGPPDQEAMEGGGEGMWVEAPKGLLGWAFVG